MSDAPVDEQDEPEVTAEDVAELRAPAVDDDGEAVRYEVVFESRDRTVGGRLVSRFEEVIGPTWKLRRTEEGPTWATTVEFPSRARAERFFASNFYRQFCNDVRRSAGTSVLVIPLGPQKD